MSPEIITGILQFGATGLLALVLYFGLQAMQKMLEVLATALARSQADNHELQLAILEFLSRVEPKNFTITDK
jgi:hypothetical protein